MDDGVYQKDFPKPETEKTALRKVIHLLKADIIALQEIGGPPFLEELRRDLKTEGPGLSLLRPRASRDTDRACSACLARAARIGDPPHELTFKYLGGTQKVKRGLLEVHVKTGGTDWALFVVHLKKPVRQPRRSRLGTAPRGRGRGGARLRAACLSDPANARFLIVGDCNALRSERPIRALLGVAKPRFARNSPRPTPGARYGHIFT